MNLNIVMVITGLGFGGAEHQVCCLADRLSEKGHKISIVTLTGDTIVKPSNQDIQIIELKMSKSILSFLNTMFKLAKFINRTRPHVVHSHMIHANIFTRLTRLFCKIPRLICTAHSNNEGGWLRMLSYRLTERFCDLTTNVSQIAVDHFISVGAASKNKIVVTYNGIDTNRFHFIPHSRKLLRKELSEQTKIVIAVGRLEEVKDFSNLITAFSEVKKQMPYCQLWLVGNGSELQKLKSLASQLHIEKEVIFLGKRADIPELMSAADVFVLSSKFEGFGLVVAEALACEKSVVATDCGGVSEVLDKHGTLVSPESSAQLSKALIDSLRQCNIPNINGRKHVIENFDINKIVNNWEILYTK